MKSKLYKEKNQEQVNYTLENGTPPPRNSDDLCGMSFRIIPLKERWLRHFFNSPLPVV
jgi:hypothetical protein